MSLRIDGSVLSVPGATLARVIGDMTLEVVMTGVRVLVGTRKGAFVLTSDGSRTDW